MSGFSKGQVRSGSDQGRFSEVDMDALGRFLRSRHPDHTAKHVAARVRRPVTTVKKWLSGEAEPSGRSMVVLVLEYGLELVAAVSRRTPAWFSAAMRAQRQQALQSELDDIRERLQALDL